MALLAMTTDSIIWIWLQLEETHIEVAPAQQGDYLVPLCVQYRTHHQVRMDEEVQMTALGLSISLRIGFLKKGFLHL